MQWKCIASRVTLPALFVVLAGCAAGRHPAPPLPQTTRSGDEPLHVRILAFNDLHGNLEPPHLAIAAPGPDRTTIRVPAGGVAYLADAIARLKAGNPYHAVVSAGDLIGASPLVSALFLDEPTIEAVNAIGIDFNTVGNHEFDKGEKELLRMQNGGCARYTARRPCALDGRFAGARFRFLAANIFKRDGTTLFPATGIKTFGSGARQVRVGFIGVTLKGTPHMVMPDGVADLVFRDEARTANALVPRLKAQGADAIVLLIHQGGITSGGYDDHGCPDLRGEIVPILEHLDPAIDVVVSGHTHRAYICDFGRYDASKPFLLTSAGRYGTLLTDIELTIDPRAHKVVAKSADNLIVQDDGYVDGDGVRIAPSDAYPRYKPDTRVQAIVARYEAAATPLAAHPVGRVTASLPHAPAPSGESVLGDLIADAQLAATAAPARGGAQIALMNPGGVRADIPVPPGGGAVTYGALFRAQPFGNRLVVKSLRGAQLRALLERQFPREPAAGMPPRVLSPSRGFTYAYDMRRAPGARVFDLRLHGVPLRDDAIYRVTVNSFLAEGGDGFTLLRQAATAANGMQDIDALAAYLRRRAPLVPPLPDRIRRVD